MQKFKTLPNEEIREFFTRRSWLHGDTADRVAKNPGYFIGDDPAWKNVLSDAEYERIKSRDFSDLTPTVRRNLSVFIEGYFRGR